MTFSVSNMSSAAATTGVEPALLRVRALEKRYWRREGWRSRQVIALHGIDLNVRRGSVVAIIGESGSGKTTLARCLAGMERPGAGSIIFAEQDFSHLSARDLRRIKSDVQLIFQDPSTSLNPRFTAEELIAEPL